MNNDNAWFFAYIAILFAYSLAIYLAFWLGSWVAKNAESLNAKAFWVAIGRLNQCKRCRATYQNDLEKCPMCCPGYYKTGLNLKKRKA